MLYQYTYFNSLWTFVHMSIIFTFGSLTIEIGLLIKSHFYYFGSLLAEIVLILMYILNFGLAFIFISINVNS